MKKESKMLLSLKNYYEKFGAKYIEKLKKWRKIVLYRLIKNARIVSSVF